MLDLFLPILSEKLYLFIILKMRGLESGRVLSAADYWLALSWKFEVQLYKTL